MNKEVGIALNKCKKIVIFGGGILATKIARKTISIGYEVAIITSPRQSCEEISKGVSFINFLNNNNLRFIVSNNINDKDIKKYLNSFGDDTFFLSLGAAWIFDKNFISKTLNGRLFNLHGTRLPQNRGGGGFSWQIMTGNRFGFCLLHIVDDGIDTGQIVNFEEFIYPHTCKYPIEYMNYYNDKNVIFLERILKNAFTGKVVFSLYKQIEYLSTYWPRLNQDSSSWIDWSQSPDIIERFICAFGPPYKGALTTINGRNVRINKVCINYQDGVFNPYQNGIVYRIGGSWICVALNGGGIIIESVSDDKTGESCISSISVGDRFITTNKMLENSKNRVTYAPSGLSK